MALRDWRLRRVVGISILWLLFLVGFTVARAVVLAHQLEREAPEAPVHIVVGHGPGALWAVLAPPLMLLIAWRWARASRPAG